MMVFKHKTQDGLSLVIALIVATVALAIGLSLLDVTLRQFILSNVARDSEISFHAAYAGIECALFEDVQNNRYAIPRSTTLSVTCMDDGSTDTDDSIASGDEQFFQYDWGTTNAACTEVSVFKYDALLAAQTIPFTVIGGENSGDNRTCNAGSICTVVQSRGYNVGCSDIGNTRTVQREVVVIY